MVQLRKVQKQRGKGSSSFSGYTPKQSQDVNYMLTALGVGVGVIGSAMLLTAVSPKLMGMEHKKRPII